MALSATVVPQFEDTLKSFKHDPLVERSSVNRSNIYLAAKVCNFKRSDGSKNLFPWTLETSITLLMLLKI